MKKIDFPLLLIMMVFLLGLFLYVRLPESWGRTEPPIPPFPILQAQKINPEAIQPKTDEYYQLGKYVILYSNTYGLLKLFKRDSINLIKERK